jgi:hypothetical protein
MRLIGHFSGGWKHGRWSNPVSWASARTAVRRSLATRAESGAPHFFDLILPQNRL